MSLISQQMTSSEAGLAVYSSGDTVPALGAARVQILSVDISSMDYKGITMGLGVSDNAAWGDGLALEFLVGGVSQLVITDEICTLLDRVFFPMNLPQNTRLELFAVNAGVEGVDVAAFVRIEPF